MIQKCGGRTATAVEDIWPVNLPGVLTNGFGIASLHRVFSFSIFSVGILGVILWESTSTSRNFKFDMGFSITFEYWFKINSGVNTLQFLVLLIVPHKRLLPAALFLTNRMVLSVVSGKPSRLKEVRRIRLKFVRKIVPLGPDAFQVNLLTHYVA